MPVNTPMVSDEYTSLVMSARTSAKIGGTMDHRPVAMSSNPSMTFLPQEAEGMTPANARRRSAMRALGARMREANVASALHVTTKRGRRRCPAPGLLVTEQHKYIRVSQRKVPRSHGTFQVSLLQLRLLSLIRQQRRWRWRFPALPGRARGRTRGRWHLRWSAA